MVSLKTEVLTELKDQFLERYGKDFDEVWSKRTPKLKKKLLVIF